MRKTSGLRENNRQDADTIRRKLSVAAEEERNRVKEEEEEGDAKQCNRRRRFQRDKSGLNASACALKSERVKGGFRDSRAEPRECTTKGRE